MSARARYRPWFRDPPAPLPPYESPYPWHDETKTPGERFDLYVGKSVTWAEVVKMLIGWNL